MEDLMKSSKIQEMLTALAISQPALMSPASQNQSFMNAAEQLEKAEKAGKPDPSSVDMSVFDRCAGCMQEIFPPNKPQRCSACKAVIYCGQACARRSWSQAPVPQSPTHKMLCPTNKRHMELLPKTQAVLQSFPWGRMESDGTFCFELAKARFKVLGAAGNGYWSVRGGKIPHQNTGPSSFKQSVWAKKMSEGFSHLDGYDLLHSKEHLSDEEGWKLKSEFIPYRDISKLSAERRPVLATKFDGGVVDWDSWYSWRKLPKDSPAALLMSFPLSVYQLIVHTLKITTPTAGSEHERVKLCVNVLGPELELNFLPAFSELALLLPYHDITLALVGDSVAKLVGEASSKGIPDSPLRRSIRDSAPIFSYDAPKELGDGTITIHLLKHPSWGKEVLFDMHSDHPELLPDAMVALNAGLGSYPSWMEVMAGAHQLDIPFAITEYAEQSLEHVVDHQLQAVMRTPPARRHDIALNPFHRPGQRSLPTFKMPNLVNGFTMVVVGRK